MRFITYRKRNGCGNFPFLHAFNQLTFTIKKSILIGKTLSHETSFTRNLILRYSALHCN